VYSDVLVSCDCLSDSGVGPHAVVILASPINAAPLPVAMAVKGQISGQKNLGGGGMKVG
jgi:hypothetical protein